MIDAMPAHPVKLYPRTPEALGINPIKHSDQERQTRGPRNCEFIAERDSYGAALRRTKGIFNGISEADPGELPGAKSSIHRYWEQFKMLFSRCTGYQMNADAVREVYKVAYHSFLSFLHISGPTDVS